MSERLELFKSQYIEDKKTGCWLWTGSITTCGYGQINIKYKRYLAHRLSWNVHNGAIPKGFFVCHKCDNPPCVNPDHLFIGTHRDNMQDMLKKGRHVQARKTHCPRGHEYNKENTHNYYSERICKTCKLSDQRIRRSLLPKKPKKTHCVNGHLMIPENRSFIKNKKSRCRICHNDESMRRYFKKREILCPKE